MIADLLARASTLSSLFYVSLAIAAAWCLFTIAAACFGRAARSEQRPPRPRRSSGMVSRDDESGGDA